MSAIFVNRRIVHYEVLGRGRPAIFLHSWVGSWRYWIPVMQSASVTCRTYALDLWGFGDTEKNHGEYTVGKQVDLLADFMEQMGIGKTALVGHGLGAVVALQFAAHFPGLVDRLMITAYPLSAAMISSRLRSQSPQELADWLTNRQSQAENVLAEAGKTDPAALSVSLNDMGCFDLEKSLFAVKNPCLVTYGENDAAVGCPRLDDTPDLLHTIYFDHSGHFPMLDESSKFNRLLGDFLAMPSGESPRQLQLKEEWKRRVR